MRDQIIALLKEKLASYPFIHALWLEGADAHGRADAYSDVDIWIDADDERIEHAFVALENTFEVLGGFDTKVIQAHDSGEIFQRFYHIAGSSPFLLLDVCIQKHSRNIILNEENTDERVVVLFDKSNVIKFRKEASTSPIPIEHYVKEIAFAFSTHHPKVEKHIQRGHFLGALQAYHHYVMEPMVELMRLQSDPTKKDFYLKHIEIDLPQKNIDILTELFAVGTLEELSLKLKKAEEFMESLLKGYL